MASLAYAVDGPQGQFHSMEITRRPVGEHDVKLEIIYCGICHSDIHQVKNEWGNSMYPMVPGHEILGRVVEVGSKVRTIYILIIAFSIKLNEKFEKNILRLAY